LDQQIVVGRVQVDVSGGSPRVDQAAIAYVRALKSGGRVDDQPETLWVRWGVRLQSNLQRSHAARVKAALYAIA